MVTERRESGRLSSAEPFSVLVPVITDRDFLKFTSPPFTNIAKLHNVPSSVPGT